MRVDPGFQPSGLLTLRLGIDREGSTKALAIKEALERLPRVKSVALSSVIPFGNAPGNFFAAEGNPLTMDPALAPRAYFHFISPDFFRTMGIPLLHGRDFGRTEESESVIVSEQVAERFWPGLDPIRKRIRIGRNNPDNPWLNIVGVVGKYENARVS